MTAIARILIAGTDNYLLAGGTDLGNFTGPGFVHQNVKAAAPASPKFPAMSIQIRNDIGASARGCFVVRLFASGDLAAAVASGVHVVPLPAGITLANITTPYTIEAFDAAGNPVADYLGRTVIPGTIFGWGAQYTFETAQRAIIKTPAQLFAARLALPRGAKGQPGTFDNTDFSKYVSNGNPMDLAGVEPGGGTTGERADIGEETEIAANYVVNPTDPVAISAMRSWDRAADAWPMFLTDDATGAMISKITYPKLNNYGWPTPDADYQGEPDIYTAMDIFNPDGSQQYGVSPDDGHIDSLNDVAYHSTGDSSSLERLQYMAGFCMWSNNGVAGLNAILGSSGGTRAMAWAFGIIVKAWRATVEAEKNGPLPAWLMPSSYFDTILTNTLAYLEQWSNSPTRSAKVFHFIPGTGFEELWQGKFFAVVSVEAVILGRTDCKAFAEWCAADTINWVKTVPGFVDPYYFNIYVPGVTLNPDNTYFDLATVPDNFFYPDIGTAFVAWAMGDMNSGGTTFNAAALNALLVDPYNGGNASPGTNADYTNYTRGACAVLAWGHSLGAVNIPDAAACLEVMNPIMQSYNGGQGWSSRRWAFMPSLDGSIPAHTPLPAPPPLPSPASVVALYPTITIPAGVIPSPGAAPTAPPPVVPPVVPPVQPPPSTGTGGNTMQFNPGSVGSVTNSNPKDNTGKADPFVTGDKFSFQVLNAADASVAADQGSFGATTFSADNLSATTPFTRPQATGSFLLRSTLTNADGTPAIGTDAPFSVGVPVVDITTFDTAIS